MSRTLTATVLALLVVLTALSPAAVSAQESTETTDLEITLVQDRETGNATVTVTNASGAVADATVNVTSSVTYTGEDQYTTDENGTVELPNPDQPLDVDVEATVDSVTTTETFTLVPVEDSIDISITQDAGGAVSLTATQYGEALTAVEVDITSDVAYDGNGTYTTDENGTVALPEPSETTTVTATLTANGVEEIQTTEISHIAEFELGVDTNDDGTATVLVTRDDAPVDNASVTVSSDVAYAGNGTYTTDENGTVALPEPEQNVTVTVTAVDGDDEATTEADLGPVDTGLAVAVLQNSDGSASVTVTDDETAVPNATVNVTSDVAYDGNGTYTTDESGTVALPAPEQNLTVTVTAINGSDEATTTADLTLIENGGFKNFGLWVASYVQQLQEGGYFGPEFGEKVSSFATENNPGADNKPDHAGPSEEKAGAADAKPEAAEKKGNAGKKSDERGPPEHAQKGDDAADDDASTGADSDCDAESSDDSCDGSDETDEDENDAPGKSGSRGGGNGGNGNGRGK